MIPVFRNGICYSRNLDGTYCKFHQQSDNEGKWEKVTRKNDKNVWLSEANEECGDKTNSTIQFYNGCPADKPWRAGDILKRLEKDDFRDNFAFDSLK
jgi:hypothetical protein